MTDYGQGAEPWEHGDPTNHEPDEIVTEDGLVATEDASDFSSGEGIVALAGIIVVGVWLVFEIFTRSYSISNVVVLIGAAAALLPRLDPDSVAKVMPLPTLMKILGYALVLGGILEVVTDIRLTIYSDGVGALLGALIAYAAYGLALVGARQIET